MWQFIWITLTVLTFSINSNGEKPPLEKCNYGDNKCMINFANKLFAEYPEGYPDMHISQLDPLPVTKAFVLKQGGNGPVNIQTKFYDSKLHGASLITFDKISGFNKNPNGKYEIIYRGPYLHVIGFYEMDGQVLLFPVRGKGRSNTTIIDHITTISFDGKEIEKNGTKYLKVENYTYTYNVKRVHLQFDNLYNGNKVLSDTTHALINDNWMEIFEEMRPVIEKSLGAETKRAFTRIFQNVPYEDLFLKT